MLSKEDLGLFLKEIKKIENKTKLESNFFIKTLKFENLEKEDLDVSFIDSSYVYGIVGPYSYIYARAAIVSKNSINIERDFLLIPDIFISSKTVDDKETLLELSDIGEIISKNLEYKLAKKANSEYILVDGSFISDAILFSKWGEFDDEEIQKKYLEFKNNFFSLIKENVFYLAKRILHARFFNSKVSDFILLLNKFPSEEFYTEILEKDISTKIPLIKKKVKAVYLRPRKNDHIYRLETNEDTKDENIVKFLYNVFYVNKSYPFGLKLAHYLAKTLNKEKVEIEAILKKNIGYDKTIGWETK